PQSRFIIRIKNAQPIPPTATISRITAYIGSRMMVPIKTDEANDPDVQRGAGGRPGRKPRCQQVILTSGIDATSVDDREVGSPEFFFNSPALDAGQRIAAAFKEEAGWPALRDCRVISLFFLGEWRAGASVSGSPGRS